MGQDEQHQERQHGPGHGVLDMADTPAKTTFIVATDRDALVLEKLAGIEQAH